MKIDGKAIASQLFQNLTKRVKRLQQKSITPQLAIILVGDDPASVSYVTRKKKKAEEIETKATIFKYALTITTQELLKEIEQLNNDTRVHGIIVQRPLPKHIDSEKVNQAVLSSKDVDAFHPATSFAMPLAKAAMLLLEHVYNQSKKDYVKTTFLPWLKTKKIVVMGKGETGGKPIIELLKKKGILPIIIDRSVTNQAKITKTVDIIICAVGKEKIISKNMIKKGVILISVGQHKETDEKFHGDYEEEDIQKKASWYSPTPGGVGPVNVACLLENLLVAAEKTT